MKKILKNSIAILSILIFCFSAIAQDKRTLDTRVADVLAQMPTKDLIHLDRLMNEIVQLGSEGFQKISQQLTPPGIGDDSAIRFALNSLSRYASQYGKNKEKAFVEENLLKALEDHSDKHVKTFLLNQLNLVAGKKTIESVKIFLTDEMLTEPATQAILSTRDKKSSTVFLEVLPLAEGKSKVTVIRALGQLKCKRAVEEITPLIHSENPDLKKTALTALASIGDPVSYKTLLKTAKAVDFRYDASHASDAFILFANRLGEQNYKELCKKACEDIIKANQNNDQLHNYAAALDIYTKHFGYEAMPYLLKAIENDNMAFRNSILNIAENVGGIAGTRYWISKTKEVNPEIKAEIIAMLGRRGDAFAIDFVTENLNSTSEPVRVESIHAMVKLKGKEALPELIDHLSDGMDIETVKTAMLQLLDQKHLAPIANLLKTTEGKSKATVIDILAAKSGTDYFENIYALTSSKNREEKEAAFMALKSVSSGSHLDALIQLLLSDINESEIVNVQEAVIAAARGIESEQHEGGKLFTMLNATAKKERIIEILPEIGGKTALDYISEYFYESTGPIKNTAFEALANWKDYSAAKTLFDICKNTKGDYHNKAFLNYIRLTQSAELPDDQKLLQFRKIMPYASSTNEKIMTINAIGNVKTFLSLIYLRQFIEITALQQAAARAIMKIALPENDQENGFKGEIVRNLLERIQSVLAGQESEYEKINIRKYLEEMARQEGFVSMFNGKNLDGWQGLVANPIIRAEMSQEALAEKQTEANQKMLENWSVRDNMIVFNGKGANLCSVKNYSDFELIVDWKITKEGDSGIYLRGTPQIQIWDTSRVEAGAQVGSGGLYNNKINESKPLKVADNPVGEWNTFRIIMVGENVTVYLNGELVVDNIPLENYWDRSRPIFETGPIELQAHGNELAFRDIYVREINTKEYGLSQVEKEAGFIALFNGKNLDGWQGNKTDYFVKNDEILVQPQRGGHGNLFTEKEYSDFIFRFEFQLTPGANNGLGIRAPLEGDAAYVGMELQILDNTAPIYSNLQDYQYHGSVYGVIPAKRGFLNPVGEWNSQEVVVNGSKIKITLNGNIILDGDIKVASKNGTMDHKDHPGLHRDKGYIGFLGHGSELKFRNIRIKDLSE